MEHKKKIHKISAGRAVIHTYLHGHRAMREKSLVRICFIISHTYHYLKSIPDMATLSNQKYGGWREDSLVKSTCCSYKASMLVPNSYVVAQNHLELQFRGL